jgi:hypothetical protein
MMQVAGKNWVALTEGLQQLACRLVLSLLTPTLKI